MFIIFGALFISTQNKQITILFNHFSKIEKFIFTSTTTDRVTPSVSPCWPRRRDPLTGDYSSSVRSPAVTIEPTWSPLRCASTKGTGWISRRLQSLHRRWWQHDSVPPRRRRRSMTSPAILRSLMYSVPPNGLNWAPNWTNGTPKHKQRRAQRHGGAKLVSVPWPRCYGMVEVN